MQAHNDLSSIATHVYGCLEAFHTICENLAKAELSVKRKLQSGSLSDHLGRFRLWVGNIGAHRRGRSSLDYRLREASHIRLRVIELLQNLKEVLQDALDIVTGARVSWEDLSDSDSDTDDTTLQLQAEGREDTTELSQLASNIVEIITCLMRLSMAIRNPAPHDQFKASMQIDLTHYESFDIDHVRGKFPWLRTILYFGWAKRSPVDDSIYAIVTNIERILSKVSSHRFRVESTVASSIPLAVKASVSTADLEEEDYYEDNLSQTSYASSASDPSRLRPPSVPKQGRDGEPLECPLCFRLTSIRQAAAWHKHVYRDLQPYLCSFEGCQVPDRTYESRHEWFQHELHAHRKWWECVDGCNKIFRSQDDFRSHLDQAHTTLGEHRLDDLIRNCEREDAMDLAAECVLCRLKLPSLTHLRRHLGKHHEELSLFALPSHMKDDEDQDADDGESGDDAGSQLSIAVSAPSDSSARIACDECGLEFDGEDGEDSEEKWNALKQHVESVHQRKFDLDPVFDNLDPRISRAKDILRLQPSIVDVTENQNFDQTLLDHGLRRHLPAKVRTWAELKDWCTQNTHLIEPSKAARLPILQVVQFIAVLASSDLIEYHDDLLERHRAHGVHDSEKLEHVLDDRTVTFYQVLKAVRALGQSDIGAQLQSSRVDGTDFHSAVTRLRQENQDKEMRLVQLERAVAMLQQKSLSLDEVNQLFMEQHGQIPEVDDENLHVRTSEVDGDEYKILRQRIEEKDERLRQLEEIVAKLQDHQMLSHGAPAVPENDDRGADPLPSRPESPSDPVSSIIIQYNVKWALDNPSRMEPIPQSNFADATLVLGHTSVGLPKAMIRFSYEEIVHVQLESTYIVISITNLTFHIQTATARDRQGIFQNIWRRRFPSTALPDWDEVLKSYNASSIVPVDRETAVTPPPGKATNIVESLNVSDASRSTVDLVSQLFPDANQNQGDQGMVSYRDLLVAGLPDPGITTSTSMFVLKLEPNRLEILKFDDPEPGSSPGTYTLMTWAMSYRAIRNIRVFESGLTIVGDINCTSGPMLPNPSESLTRSVEITIVARSTKLAEIIGEALRQRYQVERMRQIYDPERGEQEVDDNETSDEHIKYMDKQAGPRDSTAAWHTERLSLRKESTPDSHQADAAAELPIARFSPESGEVGLYPTPETTTTSLPEPYWSYADEESGYSTLRCAYGCESIFGATADLYHHLSSVHKTPDFQDLLAKELAESSSESHNLLKSSLAQGEADRQASEMMTPDAKLTALQNALAENSPYNVQRPSEEVINALYHSRRKKMKIYFEDGTSINSKWKWLYSSGDPDLQKDVASLQESFEQRKTKAALLDDPEGHSTTTV